MTRRAFTTFQYPKEQKRKKRKARPVLLRLKIIICLRISYFVSASLESAKLMEISSSPFTFSWICWRGDCRALLIFNKYRFSFSAIAVLKNRIFIDIIDFPCFQIKSVNVKKYIRQPPKYVWFVSFEYKNMGGLFFYFVDTLVWSDISEIVVRQYQ